MSEPYIGEIKFIGYNFAPRGWAYCNGQLLQIAENTALFSILGTAYGGDGRTTFGLPDLRGRTALHKTMGYNLGAKGGEPTHALTTAELPSHTHQLQASADGSSRTTTLSGNVLTVSTGQAYADADAGSMANMAAGALTSAGTGATHNNMQPFVAIGFCIALVGIYPSRS